jgi:hypothetical protein
MATEMVLTNGFARRSSNGVLMIAASQERTVASTIRTSTPPSVRIVRDRPNDPPQTGSSKSGAGASRQATPPSTIARAIDAREECRREMGAGRRHAAPGRFEDRVAFGMFHPDESAVALMALLEVAYASRKRVAGRDLRSIAGDKHSADPANPVRAQRRREQSLPHLGAGRHASTVHVALESFPIVHLRSSLSKLVSTQQVEFGLSFGECAGQGILVSGPRQAQESLVLKRESADDGPRGGIALAA